MVASGLLAAALAVVTSAADSPGVIEGVVVNGSRGQAAVAGAEVVLRVDDGSGRFVPVARTTTDRRGRFTFANLPVDRRYVYLPGANHAGVHYPGPRFRLDAAGHRVDLTLIVYDAVGDPSPLVARRHDVLLEIETGVLQVTESLLISNSTTTTYIGPSVEGRPPETLRLSIPPDFDKVTFQKEFFGRHFKLADGRLITDIPFTPGERRLAFTYWLPFERRDLVWTRPLDLPTSEFRLRIAAGEGDPGQARCNLPRAPAARDGEPAFAWRAAALPAGYVVRLELGCLPVPWMVAARWVALAVLAGLLLALIIPFGRRQRHGRARRAAAARRDGPHWRRRARADSRRPGARSRKANQQR